MAHKTPKPQNVYELTISLNADSVGSIIAALRSMATDIALYGVPKNTSISGGCSSGFSITAKHNPNQTKENYLKEIDQWLADIKNEGKDNEQNSKH